MNLGKLLENSLIFVSENFDNGTPGRYQITEKGKKYLDDNFDADELLSYFEIRDESNLLFRITEVYIERRVNNITSQD